VWEAWNGDTWARCELDQDETGGLQAFIPLAFHSDGNGMKNLPPPTAADDLRTLAVSRLMLDNVPHIKAYWVSMTPKIAQVGLRMGADDIDGTIIHETIYHAAGSGSPQGLTEAELIRLIREAGRVPVERDTLYNVVREHPRVAVPEAARPAAFRTRDVAGPPLGEDLPQIQGFPEGRPHRLVAVRRA